ncbi:hypothetical protein Tco_0050667 [Tanacetum coccineum]
MTWRTTERQWSVDFDSDMISFRIQLVNLIYEHLMTLLHLELKVNAIWVESFNNFISLPFEIFLSKLGLVYLSAVPVYESRHVASLSKQGVLNRRFIGSGVAGLSSTGSGFHQYFLKSAFGR